MMQKVSASNVLMETDMSHDIPERDWKKLRTLKDNALDIACERIFHKINNIGSSPI